ncbi:hypothetical protein TNCV_3736001 [Trichonephila clavipes]|nr:hypothetical protein TNCV_3736001 [Trichonephila clavipes]
MSEGSICEASTNPLEKYVGYHFALFTTNLLEEEKLGYSNKLTIRSLGYYWRKTLVIDYHNLFLNPISYYSGNFAMREKGSNRLVPGPDYMEDALKLSNQTHRVSGESLQTCVTWRCPDETQHLFCWPILAVSGQSLASNGPAVDNSF